MDFLRSSTISNNSNFQLLGVSKNSNIEFKNSMFLLNDLNESLNKNLTESVFDFMKCFICLSQTNDPLSCPKCNNFACKKCLENYFGEQTKKKCPLCKQDIIFEEMKENRIIREIENILNKDDTKKNKINELSKLIEKNKNKWKEQTHYLNNIIEKIFKFQESLQDYKKEYELFLLNCQKVVEKTFMEYQKETEKLINSLLSCNKNADDSIKKYDDINNKNKNNYYNDNNIKDLINEILSMERKQFNEKNNDETDNFLNTSIKIIPSLSNYKIREIKLIKDDFNKYNSINTKGNHYKLGEFQIKYNFNVQDKYKAFCELSFSLKDNINACFIITQNKIGQNYNQQKLFPMKLTNRNGGKFIYECLISFDEFDIGKEKEVKMETEALMFSI